MRGECVSSGVRVQMSGKSSMCDTARPPMSALRHRGFLPKARTILQEKWGHRSPALRYSVLRARRCKLPPPLAHLDVLCSQVIVNDSSVGLAAPLGGETLRRTLWRAVFYHQTNKPNPGLPLKPLLFITPQVGAPQWGNSLPPRPVPLTLARARSKSRKMPLVSDLMSSAASTWKSGMGAEAL